MRLTSDGANNADLPFIDFIVCPSYHLAYNDSVLQQYGLTRNKYRNQGIFYPSGEIAKNITLRQILDFVTHDIYDLLFEVRFDTQLSDDIGQSSFVETFDAPNENLKHIKITTKHSPTYGKCYSIRPRTHVLKYGIIVVDIVARMDIMIYLGYPGQFMYNTKTKVSTFCSICFQLFYFDIKSSNKA